MDPAQAPDPPLSLLIVRMEVRSVDKAHPGIRTQRVLVETCTMAPLTPWPPPGASYPCPSYVFVPMSSSALRAVTCILH